MGGGGGAFVTGGGEGSATGGGSTSGEVGGAGATSDSRTGGAGVSATISIVTGSGDAVSVTGVAQVSKAASAATCRAAEMAASQDRLLASGERSLAVKAGSSRAGRIAAMSKPLEAEAASPDTDRGAAPLTTSRRVSGADSESHSCDESLLSSRKTIKT
jgi:hypothetical protein